jgi:hypothetical protein
MIARARLHEMPGPAGGSSEVAPSSPGWVSGTGRARSARAPARSRRTPRTFASGTTRVGYTRSHVSMKASRVVTTLIVPASAPRTTSARSSQSAPSRSAAGSTGCGVRPSEGTSAVGAGCCDAGAGDGAGAQAADTRTTRALSDSRRIRDRMLQPGRTSSVGPRLSTISRGYSMSELAHTSQVDG